MRYLIDSPLVIDHGNGDPGAVNLLRQLVEEGHELFVCDVVTCEALSFGGPFDLAAFEALLASFEYVSTSPAAARWAGASRRSRHRAGGKRAVRDALIGGVASELEAVVVTRNRRDFEQQGIPVLDY